MRRALVLPVVILLGGCANDATEHPAPVATKTASYVTIDAPALCRLFTTDCPTKSGQTYDDCLKVYEAMRVPTECKALLDAFTCDSPKSQLDTCWPQCSGLAAECDGPNITECSASGRRYTYECHGVCATQNKAWSGICGVTYKNESAGRPTCWCN
jgi:hypothetical protein